MASVFVPKTSFTMSILAAVGHIPIPLDPELQPIRNEGPGPRAMEEGIMLKDKRASQQVHLGLHRSDSNGTYAGAP